MSRTFELLFTDLRHLIADLGRHGGLISPSIYDTARAAQLVPPPGDVWPVLEWLLAQQQPDGGWGNSAVPRARDLPTLAAILALHTHNREQCVRDAVRRGLAFLRRQGGQWAGPLGADLPVGVELLLPRLFEAATAADLPLASAPYAELLELGRRRRRMIAAMPGITATTAVHSWEAWGTEASPTLLDGAASVGHSPAATAAWLAEARGPAAGGHAAASAYLAAAARATGSGVPGVLPTVWPIDRFELSFGLHPVAVAGLLERPELARALAPRLDELAAAIGPAGLGLSDHFLPDGDITAASLAVLSHAGRRPSIAPLRRFASDDHFCAYIGELQSSLSVTAHAIHALACANADAAAYSGFIATRQLADGRWPGDKWHGSWLYTTSRAMLALHACGQGERLGAAVDALGAHQRPEGGWGAVAANPEETAYAALALLTMLRTGWYGERIAPLLERARAYLLASYRPFADDLPTLWQGKELYLPTRITRAYILSAATALALWRSDCEERPHV